MRADAVPFEWFYDCPSRNGVYKPAAYRGRGVRLVNMGELFGYEFIGTQEMDRIELSEGELARLTLRDGDLLFGRRSVVEAGAGKCSLVMDPAEPMTFESSIIRVRLDRQKANPRYFYYYFASPFGRGTVRTIVSGAAIKGIRGTALASLPVSVPPKEVQDRIASVLQAYDDLIENNRRRMALLEEAARQLYREWFVRLRFPGHEHARIVDGVPEGWERVPLGSRVALHYGKALKEDVRVAGSYPVYGSSGIVGTHSQALTTAPGIVVGRKGNVGSVYWSYSDYWPIDTVFFVDSTQADLWLFYAFQQLHFISTDVAVPGLNRDFAYSRPLLVPASRVRSLFVNQATTLYRQISKLSEMNEALRLARDLLLPRLMSGDIAL